MAIGGSIEAVSLAGRRFSVPADNEAQIKDGGMENEVQANGDGSARVIQTRVPLSISGLMVEVDADTDDQEFLQNIADSGEFVACAITLTSGVVKQGKVQIVGEIQSSTQNSTASISLMGPGKLTKQ